jgi:hypothetical protein
LSSSEPSGVGWYAVRLRSREPSEIRVAFVFPLRRSYVVELHGRDRAHLPLSDPRLHDARFRGPFVTDEEAQREATRWRGADGMAPG